MAVQRIEQYRQLNGVDILKVILKPAKQFPNGGYFYAPTEAIDLVNKYTWFLHSNENRIYVLSHDNSTYKGETLRFHCKLFEFYQGYKWSGDIDHISLYEIDNTDSNLNAVIRRQNSYNKFTRGYALPANCYLRFHPRIMLCGRNIYPMGYLKTEDEVCISQNYIEQVFLFFQINHLEKYPHKM